MTCCGRMCVYETWEIPVGKFGARALIYIWFEVWRQMGQRCEGATPGDVRDLKRWWANSFRKEIKKRSFPKPRKDKRAVDASQLRNGRSCPAIERMRMEPSSCSRWLCKLVLTLKQKWVTVPFARPLHSNNHYNDGTHVVSSLNGLHEIINMSRTRPTRI